MGRACKRNASDMDSINLASPPFPGPIAQTYINPGRWSTHPEPRAEALTPCMFRPPPTSDMDASATPPTMGSSVASTAAEGTSPRNSADSSTLKKGSMACVG